MFAFTLTVTSNPQSDLAHDRKQGGRTCTGMVDDEIEFGL